ncbi:MAG: methylmalonyl Co-A mutase-associated GTPase MeaB [Nitrospiria bacterium]
MQRKSSNKKNLINKILKGELRPASRLLTLVERREPSAIPFLKKLYPHTGKAWLIGITGPSGVGKSTLVCRLISALRRKRRSIGVLAIDPVSPFTGGAILGDRIRMQPHFLDKKVFIRSLTTQRSRGGISPTLFDAIHVLDAMGKEIIIVETVGVGQDEVEIAGLAETVVLVLAPGYGDAVQILKAGLLEIGDIIVVNKGDLKGAGRLVQQLKEMNPSRTIIKVSALKGEGLSSLTTQLHQAQRTPETFRKSKIRLAREELEALLRENLFRGGLDIPFTNDEIDSVCNRKQSPYSLVGSWMKKNGGNLS